MSKPIWVARRQIGVAVKLKLNMEAVDAAKKQRTVQGVLPVVESAEGRDRDYDHLVAHLFPEEEQEGRSHRWTRIFGS